MDSGKRRESRDRIPPAPRRNDDEGIATRLWPTRGAHGVRDRILYTRLAMLRRGWREAPSNQSETLLQAGRPDRVRASMSGRGHRRSGRPLQPDSGRGRQRRLRGRSSEVSQLTVPNRHPARLHWQEHCGCADPPRGTAVRRPLQVRGTVGRSAHRPSTLDGFGDRRVPTLDLPGGSRSRPNPSLFGDGGRHTLRPLQGRQGHGRDGACGQWRVRDEGRLLYSADPTRLDRHPVEIGRCRTVEHWDTGYCYVFREGGGKVSQAIDDRCDNLPGLRDRMLKAIRQGFCDSRAPDPELETPPRPRFARQSPSSGGRPPPFRRRAPPVLLRGSPYRHFETIPDGSTAIPWTSASAG